jgi:hypothetical protein
MVKFNLPVSGLYFTIKTLEQSGFAGAIRTHHHTKLSSLQLR